MVQEKLIELFQEWALLFQSDPSLAYLYDTYCNLKASKRVIFPIPAKSLDQVNPLSIVSSMAPPEWSDSQNCQRCRDQFTITNRKHHCRKCGGTFCQLCSSNEMVLLEMGINEPVRVCDSCYRQPAAVNNEKRHTKVLENKPVEDTEEAEIKKAIELSLKEQQKVNPGKTEDDEALKKAIEASLKEAGPNHMTTSQKPETNQQKFVKFEMFNPVELENISMFHQLIGRLVRMRPQLSQEDVRDLRKLAGEMRKLRKRSIEDFNVKNQLEESLKGYELLFGIEDIGISDPSTTTTTVSRQQIHSPPSSLAEDLNKMKNEVFGDTANNLMRGPEIGLVRTRLGSLSLENQLANTQSHSQSLQSQEQPAYHSNTPPNFQRVYEPMPLPAYQHNLAQNQIQPLHPEHQPQYQLQPQDQIISPPIAQSSYRHSLPVMTHGGSPPHHYTNHRSTILPVQSNPIQMCPEMTIHPHPVHPSFSHVNPYAKVTEQQQEEKAVKVKKEKKEKKKLKKDQKESTDKEEKKRRKKEKLKKKDDETKTEKSSGTSKKTKDSKSGEKRIKSIKMEIIVDAEEPTKKRKSIKTESKQKSELKIKKSDSKSKKYEVKLNEEDKSKEADDDKTNNLVMNTVDEGRRSPINLIDL